MGASQDPTGEIITDFAKLAVASPAAVATLVLSWFCGYGISFVVFDYRRSNVRRSHYWFHASIGLAYAAVIFVCVNSDILGRNLTAAQVEERTPLTLVVSFAVCFAIMIVGAVCRELVGARPRR